MGRFHFDESAADTVMSSFCGIMQNIRDCSNALSNISMELNYYEGFNIGYAIESINDEKNVKFRVCINTLETGYNVLRSIQERVIFYNQLAASKQSLTMLEHIHSGNVANEFDKFREEYFDFLDNEVDFWLLSKTTFSQLTNAGKMSLEKLIEDVRKLNFKGVFDNNTAEIYDEYYTAKYLEEVYTNVEFDDSLLDDTDDFIKLVISDPSKIAELLSKLKVKEDSLLGIMLKETIGAAHSEQIKLMGTVTEVSDYIVGMIKEMITDYSKTLESINIIKNAISGVNGNNKMIEYLDELYDKYSKSNLERVGEYMQHCADKTASSAIYKGTIGKFTQFVDIPADYLNAFDSDIESFLELRFTDNLASQLTEGYKRIGEKVSSGNYTAEDLQQYAGTFNAMKDMYIYRYERMIEITDDSERVSTYKQQLEKLKNMNL